MKDLSIKKNSLFFFNQLQFEPVGGKIIHYSREKFLENPEANNFTLFDEYDDKRAIDELKQKIILSVFFSKLTETSYLNSTPSHFAGITDIISTHYKDNLCSTLRELKDRAKTNKLGVFCFSKIDNLNNYYFAIDPKEIIVKYVLPKPKVQTQTIFSKLELPTENIVHTLISIKINPKNTYIFIKSL